MKKNFVTILFFAATAVFAQDLKNPRLELNSSSSWSNGNYLLFINSDRYMQKSAITVSDVSEMLKEWGKQKKIIEEQKRMIDDLKKVLEAQQRQLNEQEKKIDNLERKMK
jgi:hypothetical protein